ncbi:unnamed protein product, partial [Brassica napus]
MTKLDNNLILEHNFLLLYFDLLILHLDIHPTTSTAAGSVSDFVSDLLLCGESTIHRHQVVTLAPSRLVFLNFSSSSTSSIRWLVKLHCAFLCALSSLPTVGEPNQGSLKPRRDLFLNQGFLYTKMVEISKIADLYFRYRAL